MTKRLPSKPLKPDITYKPTKRIARYIESGDVIDVKKTDWVQVEFEYGYYEGHETILSWDEPYSREEWKEDTKKALVLYRASFSSYMTKLKKSFAVETNLETLIELKKLEEERAKKLQDFKKDKTARERIRLEKEIKAAQKKLKELNV